MILTQVGMPTAAPRFSSLSKDGGSDTPANVVLTWQDLRELAPQFNLLDLRILQGMYKLTAVKTGGQQELHIHKTSYHRYHYADNTKLTVTVDAKAADAKIKKMTMVMENEFTGEITHAGDKKTGSVYETLRFETASGKTYEYKQKRDPEAPSEEIIRMLTKLGTNRVRCNEIDAQEAELGLRAAQKAQAAEARSRMIKTDLQL